MKLKASELKRKRWSWISYWVKAVFCSKSLGIKDLIILVINADESEPGTCKDRDIIRFEPHKAY